MAVEFFIGRRYLRAKQKQAFISLITFLSVAGVTVGVMALIIVIAVMAGFESELKSRILNVNAHISLQTLSPISDYRPVIETVEQTPGVESATPIIETQVMLRASSRSSAALIRGVDLPSAGRVFPNLDTDPLTEHEKSRREDPDLDPGIVLGKELATYLGTVEGDTVQLIFPRISLSPAGIKLMPAMDQYQVVGSFESGMYEYDRQLGFIPLADAQSLQGIGDKVNLIEIRVNDIDKAGSVREKIVETLGLGFWALDWMQKNENFFSALELEKIVMFIILTLIVLVAAFNIASTLIMMVMEKKKDIAILRAMGATDRQIRRIFVFKGMVIGLIGTLLGNCLGVIPCIIQKHYGIITLPGEVYFVSELPVEPQPLDAISISLAALAICFLATLYPAHQASKMNPVEAIRNA